MPKTFEEYFEDALKGVEPSDEEEEARKAKEEEEAKRKAEEAEPNAEEEQNEDIFNNVPEAEEDHQEQDNDGEDQTGPDHQEQDWKSLYEKEVQKTRSWSGRIRKANERAETAEHRAEAAEKKVEELTTQVQQLQTQLQAKGTKDDTLPEGDGKETSEELEKFWEEFPDLRRPLELLVKQEAARIADERLDKLQPTVKNLSDEVEDQRLARHYAMISEAHGDWEEVRDSGALAKWIEAQPSYLREPLKKVCSSGTAAEIIEMLTSFKRSTGWKQPAPSKPGPSREEKEKAALAVPHNSGGLPKKKAADPNDFDAGWEDATGTK